MNDPRLDELAALHHLGFLNTAEKEELLDALENKPGAKALDRSYAETLASLAHEAPQVAPPPGLQRDILHRLPAKSTGAKVIKFTAWLPYAIAACLMVVSIYQARQILHLKARLFVSSLDIERLSKSNALLDLRLAELDAHNPVYSASKIMVAWDPYQHRGVISMQNLPAAQAGQDYQLWVLDPGALAPISAGTIKPEASTGRFEVKPLTTQTPGFAVTLEPAGGSPAPTTPILFAIAPGQ